MKYALSICILICLCATAHAQYASLGDDFSGKKNYLKSPIVKEVNLPLAPIPKFSGRGQKILGISLTFGGIAFMVVGGLEIALSQIADSNSITSDEKDILVAEGAVLAIIGVAATTTGIIFWRKGAKNSGRGRGAIIKSPSYQQNLSLGLKGAGAGLRLRF